MHSSAIVKRAFDLTLAVILAIPVIVAGSCIALWLLLRQGGDVFHVSERIGQNNRPFGLLKFRTMVPAPDGGVATGGDKAGRVTPAGHWLRRHRLDELPQLWNILRGEMSFVGPRPPLRRYVDRNPGLYARVLRSKPGLTGLATIVYHRTEAALLARSRSAEETDRFYSRVCVPRKARLDLIYQRNACLRLDALLIARTIGQMVKGRK